MTNIMDWFRRIAPSAVPAAVLPFAVPVAVAPLAAGVANANPIPGQRHSQRVHLTDSERTDIFTNLPAYMAGQDPVNYGELLNSYRLEAIPHERLGSLGLSTREIALIDSTLNLGDHDLIALVYAGGQAGSSADENHVYILGASFTGSEVYNIINQIGGGKNPSRDLSKDNNPSGSKQKGPSLPRQSIDAFGIFDGSANKATVSLGNEVYNILFDRSGKSYGLEGVVRFSPTSGGHYTGSLSASALDNPSKNTLVYRIDGPGDVEQTLDQVLRETGSAYVVSVGGRNIHGGPFGFRGRYGSGKSGGSDTVWKLTDMTQGSNNFSSVQNIDNKPSSDQTHWIGDLLFGNEFVDGDGAIAIFYGKSHTAQNEDWHITARNTLNGSQLGELEIHDQHRVGDNKKWMTGLSFDYNSALSRLLFMFAKVQGDETASTAYNDDSGEQGVKVANTAYNHDLGALVVQRTGSAHDWSMILAGLYGKSRNLGNFTNDIDETSKLSETASRGRGEISIHRLVTDQDELDSSLRGREVVGKYDQLVREAIQSDNIYHLDRAVRPSRGLGVDGSIIWEKSEETGEHYKLTGSKLYLDGQLIVPVNAGISLVGVGGIERIRSSLGGQGIVSLSDQNSDTWRRGAGLRYDFRDNSVQVTFEKSGSGKEKYQAQFTLRF